MMMSEEWNPDKPIGKCVESDGESVIIELCPAFVKHMEKVTGKSVFEIKNLPLQFRDKASEELWKP